MEITYLGDSDDDEVEILSDDGQVVSTSKPQGPIIIDEVETLSDDGQVTSTSMPQGPIIIDEVETLSDDGQVASTSKPQGHIIIDEVEILSDDGQVASTSKPQGPIIIDEVETLSDDGQVASTSKPQRPIIIDVPAFNPEVYNRLVAGDQQKRLFGGKMTKQRLEKVHQITGELISSMHKAVTEAPENIATEAPNGLKVDLMPHQKYGLTWMLWRESGSHKSIQGGILADDMGLGKTLSMISLILHRKNARQADEKAGTNAEEIVTRREAATRKGLVYSNSTLVIAPASLIYQWEKEVQDRVKDGRLTVHVFHGAKNKRESSPRRLAEFDIVITTYALVSNELSEKLLPDDYSDGEVSDADYSVNSPFQKKSKKDNKRHVARGNVSVLTKVSWDRIILDEAHQVKNRQSLVSKSCCRIPAVNRWCLTGTPIHNELWDLFSLIRFLRVVPFSEEKVWKELIMSNSRNNSERLNALVKGLLLRRTKTQICSVTNKPIVDLQPRQYELVTLSLQEPEKQVYAVMFAASKQKVKDLLNNKDDIETFGHVRNRKKQQEVIKNPFLTGSREFRSGDRFQQMSCVLVLLLRLRQACTHMALTKHAVDMNAFKEDGGDDNAVLEDLDQSMAQLSLDEDQIQQGLGAGDADKAGMQRIFEPSYESTKVVAVLERVDKVLDAGDKWASMLTVVEFHLKKKRIKYTSITGAILTKDRQERVDSFNKVGSGAEVMLLSLTAGGVGLNLVGGNHLFLLDLHWNPALEQQACDRIYRLGQKKNVFIHKFLCDQTIEQRVQELQQKKTAMATSVLEGAASKKLSKLTMNELKFLFELDKPQYKQ